MNEKESLVPVILAGLLVVTMLAVVGVLITVVVKSDKNNPCVDGTVISVGGCEKDGRCGVSVFTKDGIIFSTAYLPVLNQNVCVHPR